MYTDPDPVPNAVVSQFYKKKYTKQPSPLNYQAPLQTFGKCQLQQKKRQFSSIYIASL